LASIWCPTVVQYGVLHFAGGFYLIREAHFSTL
jgi:hypothetical protein